MAAFGKSPASPDPKRTLGEHRLGLIVVWRTDNAGCLLRRWRVASSERELGRVLALVAKPRAITRRRDGERFHSISTPQR